MLGVIDAASLQSYTSAAQRRVAPTALTGVSGRATMAWAVETKLWTPGIESFLRVPERNQPYGAGHRNTPTLCEFPVYRRRTFRLGEARRKKIRLLLTR
jgi:hypothetical protein